jgi:PleD family two-component response regulator
MKVLIAEDDAISCRLLEARLSKWGYEVVKTVNGLEAFQQLSPKNAPRIAILDWMMPEMDGVEVCRKIRSMPAKEGIYIILLTAKTTKENIVEGLIAGADDYLMKPFHDEELRARLQTGVRITKLQSDLAARVIQLEDALSKVKQLQGLLPICSYCKKIRDDGDYWRGVESYISQHTDAEFSHSVCPGCYASHLQPELEKLKLEKTHPSGRRS